MRSVLGQTFRDLELVVVDDGSRAPTLEILRRLAAEDQRMRLIEGTHRGQIGTLNHAIEHCRGELLARLDHDDNCLPERIARQVAYMDANPDVVAIGSATQRIDEHGIHHGDARTKEAAARTDPSTLPPTLVFLMGPTLMARASAMRAIGGYRPQFRAAEDRDISWRLARSDAPHTCPTFSSRTVTTVAAWASPSSARRRSAPSCAISRRSRTTSSAMRPRRSRR